MTLHINTITPTHIISVSDRLISTSRGFLELADDRYKHLILTTDDGNAILSFAGFAGILNNDGGFEVSTLDWLTELCIETSRRGKHTIDAHLNDLRDESNRYIDSFKKMGVAPEMLRLAIVAIGRCNNQQFTCVIDNCLEKYWLWSKKARSTFTTKIRNYSKKNKFTNGYIIQILGDERLALKQRPLRKLLEIYAQKNDPKKIFDVSVRIIRAASSLSNGTIGTNCSGIRMSKNDPGIESYDDRPSAVWEMVMPNTITSRSNMSFFVSNIKGKNFEPKPPAILKFLRCPETATTNLERLAFWYRVVEKLRLLHNQQGNKLGKKPKRDRVEAFHQWQDDIFHPIQAMVFQNINNIRTALRAEAPSLYTNEYFSKIKNEQRTLTLWDKNIELSDVELFELKQ